MLRLRFLVGKLGTIINEAMSRRFSAHRKDSPNGECTHTHTCTQRHMHAYIRKTRLERKTQQVSFPCDRHQLDLILYTDDPCIAPLLVLQWRSKKKKKRVANKSLSREKVRPTEGWEGLSSHRSDNLLFA